MRHLRATLFVALALAAIPLDALACRHPGNNTSFFYTDDIPNDLPPNAIILDVIFVETIQPAAYHQHRLDRARVRHVVRGDFEGNTVTVLLGMTSCSQDVAPGDQGAIIGEMRTLADGRAVFIAMQESAMDRAARHGRR